MPPLLANFIHARGCKPKCEKSLTRPPYLLLNLFYLIQSRSYAVFANRAAAGLSGRRPISEMLDCSCSLRKEKFRTAQESVPKETDIEDRFIRYAG